MHLKNQKKAYLFALLTVLFWSSMSSAFKLTLNAITFDSMLFWSSIFGFVVLLVINQSGHSPLKIRLVSKGELLRSAIMGFFNPFLYYLILFKAYQLLEAQLAGTLNYLWPLVLVMLSGIFLRQKIHLVSYLALLISFIGVVIISTKGAFSVFTIDQPLGVILASGSAFIWAIYWILNMKDSREETGKITLNLFFGIIYLLIYMVFTDGITIPENIWGWVGCVYIGIFEMSFTFVIWLKALQFSENTAKVSNLIYLSPFLGLFFIWIFVGEPIHFSTIVGLSVIIAGILLQQFSKTPSESSDNV
ncbi:MAG: DMT family transporter [Bacteroidetes bacterium]|nr:DMT family transporter [Bacteroidota bacterium]